MRRAGRQGPAATLVLAVLLAAAAAAGEPAVLGNPGFEKGLEGWRVRSMTGGLRSALDRERRKEGEQSLHLSKRGKAGMDNVHADLAGLVPGGRVRVAAWVRTEGARNAWLKCFFHDDAGESVGLVEERLRADMEWTRVELDATVPEGAASATLFVLLFLPGDVWIDDVAVTGPGVGGAALPGRTGPAEAAPAPLDAGLETWLDGHAVRVATLDFDAPRTDLAKVAELVRGARIVQLGEQTHMDGATFRAKARLARFLHERAGFDVIAFESGLFECEEANRLLAENRPLDALDASVFGIWRVEEVRPLFAYMARTAQEVRRGRPLRLSGFDIRGSGRLAAEFLPRLFAFLEPLGDVPDEDRRALAAIDGQLAGHPYRPAEDERAAARAALARLRARFDEGRARLVEAHGERRTAFFSQCLDGYAKREAFEFSKNGDDRARPGNLRDAAMAQNLRWLAEERYPDAKILTWAATSHQAHDLVEVTIGGSNELYRTWKNMGQYLHDWYGDRVFTIGFAAYRGEAGRFGPAFRLAKPRAGSFEDLLHRYGQPFVLVPLRGETPFGGPMHASPMSYDRSIRAPWPKVLDALFYVETMTPTTLVDRD